MIIACFRDAISYIERQNEHSLPSMHLFLMLLVLQVLEPNHSETFLSALGKMAKRGQDNAVLSSAYPIHSSASEVSR